MSRAATQKPAPARAQQDADGNVIPEDFVVVMPDDALAPNIPRGMRLGFKRDLAPQPGHGVLVQDRTGRRYIRRYAQGPGDTWQAQAVSPDHPSLESERDGLVLLAVMYMRYTSRL